MTTWLTNVNWAAIKAHEKKWQDLPTLQVTPSPDSALRAKIRSSDKQGVLRPT